MLAGPAYLARKNLQRLAHSRQVLLERLAGDGGGLLRTAGDGVNRSSRGPGGGGDARRRTSRASSCLSALLSALSFSMAARCRFMIFCDTSLQLLLEPCEKASAARERDKSHTHESAKCTGTHLHVSVFSVELRELLDVILRMVNFNVSRVFCRITVAIAWEIACLCALGLLLSYSLLRELRHAARRLPTAPLGRQRMRKTSSYPRGRAAASSLNDWSTLNGPARRPNPGCPVSGCYWENSRRVGLTRTVPGGRRGAFFR